MTPAEWEAIEKYIPTKLMQNSKEMIRWNFEVFDQARKATQNGIVAIEVCLCEETRDRGKWQWTFEVYDPKEARLGHYLDDVTKFELKVNYIAARGFNRDVALTFTKEQWAEYKTFPADYLRDDPNHYKTLEFTLRYGWIRTVTAEEYVSDEERHAINYYRAAEKLLEGKTKEERSIAYNREEFDYDLYAKGKKLLDPYDGKPLSLRIDPQRLTRPKVFYNKMKWDYGLEFFDGQFDVKTERFKKELKEVIYEPLEWDIEKKQEVERREEAEDRYLNPVKYLSPELQKQIEEQDRIFAELEAQNVVKMREWEAKRAARSTFWRDVKNTVGGLLFPWTR